jgi:hypothetical protein
LRSVRSARLSLAQRQGENPEAQSELAGSPQHGIGFRLPRRKQKAEQRRDDRSVLSKEEAEAPEAEGQRQTQSRTEETPEANDRETKRAAQAEARNQAGERQAEAGHAETHREPEAGQPQNHTGKQEAEDSQEKDTPINMATRKRKRKTTRKPNPSSPSVKTGTFIPCRGVVLDKRGVVKKMLVEDKNMGKALKRRKR